MLGYGSFGVLEVVFALAAIAILVWAVSLAARSSERGARESAESEPVAHRDEDKSRVAHYLPNLFAAIVAMYSSAKLASEFSKESIVAAAIVAAISSCIWAILVFCQHYVDGVDKKETMADHGRKYKAIKGISGELAEFKSSIGDFGKSVSSLEDAVGKSTSDVASEFSTAKCAVEVAAKKLNSAADKLSKLLDAGRGASV
ncbi:hypothetical protein [Paramagnetospirillum magneticum]|uniref:hypothetical protein n=1 Tax=Paramagnetospirillum magneticum TaxID=84159 RepID=UPI0011D0971F|nr:hypothetical protein [Paramagnetospirillum magneticum]